MHTQYLVHALHVANRRTLLGVHKQHVHHRILYKEKTKPMNIEETICTYCKLYDDCEGYLYMLCSLPVEPSDVGIGAGNVFLNSLQQLQILCPWYIDTRRL